MYILRNALKCIGRSKVRNILLGMIVLIIAISSCIGLSVRQAALNARKETLESRSITANISFDRTAAMSIISGETKGENFDRSKFNSIMGNASALSLDEYLLYAKAESVKDFRYSMTAYVNGTGDFEPVGTDTGNTETAASDTSASVNGFGDRGGKGGHIFGYNSDFSITGYSSERAMTSFLNGNASIIEGKMFDAGTNDGLCIITRELASFNSLSVGDSISVSNPNNEEEVYALSISGIYTEADANTNSFSTFGSTSSDPANQILVSYKTLENITVLSKEAAEAENAAEETPATNDTSSSKSSAISGTLSATYEFADIAAYESFGSEARALGLADTYAISSSDITSFETGLIPLNTLSKTAGYFFLVILTIGAMILVVLNIFNVRERKYEIGVLTAMGMKKGKVALQFLIEIFLITSAAIIIGTGIGAVSSVPVTNALLKNQVASQNAQAGQTEKNFGRGQKNPINPAASNSNRAVVYISEIKSAMNFTVVLQLFGIGLLLTLLAGTVSMLFVMRYEPLKILANRD